MTYPGGKNGAGAYQRIINHMPPHMTYIEAFLGSGAVLRNKRVALRNIGIDRSESALDLCLDLAGAKSRLIQHLEGDALKLLPSLKSMVSDSPRNLINRPTTLIYADPPYMMETRKGADIYDFEMSDADHVRLLDILTAARCMVMLSGYRSKLYDDRLSGFHRVDYMAQSRRGMVPESLWMNFPHQLRCMITATLATITASANASSVRKPVGRQGSRKWIGKNGWRLWMF